MHITALMGQDGQEKHMVTNKTKNTMKTPNEQTCRTSDVIWALIVANSCSWTCNGNNDEACSLGAATGAN
jgi:hypothetical protein